MSRLDALVFDQYGLAYDTVMDERIRQGGLRRSYDVLVFQSQSPRAIVEGNPPGSLPPEYTGGIGQEGIEALRAFVREGGRLVAIEQATDLAIEIFGLGVSNAVAGLRARTSTSRLDPARRPR